MVDLRLVEAVQATPGWDKPQPSRDPANFAPFIAYLASDEAASVNGCVFYTTGSSIGVFNEPRVTRHVSRNPEEEGPWTFDEIAKLVPETLLADYENPGPPETELTEDYYGRMLQAWQRRVGLPK